MRIVLRQFNKRSEKPSDTATRAGVCVCVLNSKPCLLRKDATQKESVSLFQIERRKSPESNT